MQVASQWAIIKSKIDPARLTDTLIGCYDLESQNWDGSSHVCIASGPDRRVTDDGPGIQADRRDAALQMLVTLQRLDVVEGSGLGFSIVQRIVNQYGSTLSLDDASNGQGCQVSVKLPSPS